MLIVVARDSLLYGWKLASDPSVVTPADLRQRLLYAVSPEAANAIAERTLDVPMRSATFGFHTSVRLFVYLLSLSQVLNSE